MNKFIFGWTAVILTTFLGNLHADLNTDAKFVVSDQVVRSAEKVPPLGANGSGGRAVNYAVNNFFENPGNEPIHWQGMFRTANIDGKSFELDVIGTSWYDLWYDG